MTMTVPFRAVMDDVLAVEASGHASIQPGSRLLSSHADLDSQGVRRSRTSDDKPPITRGSKETSEPRRTASGWH